MADRTVTAKLVADTSSYTPATQTATKATSELAAAQKEAASSNKAEAESTASSTTQKIEAARQTRLLTTAQRDATAAAREAAAANSEATASLSAAQKEVAAAAKDTTELAAARQAAAQEALDAAEKEAVATAETKAAADAQTKAATAALVSFKDETAASRENSAEQAANAAATEAAATKRKDAYTGTSKVALVAGAAVAAGFYAAEKATSDFNKSLSGVQAVSSASAADMGLLRNAALDAGKATAFTATEAADAEGELVKAGVSVKDVLGGALSGALSLAAAGQLDLADAATISANAMNTFALKGSDVPHIADVLAAAANKSAADVSQLAYAMQQGGLVAAQTGLSFEDTTAILAAFADRGLEGADAGTSLKTMLEKLNAPTSQASSLMQSLGITTYDASGKFVGITALAGELHDKLGVLTDQQRNQALATIFGSDAIRAASVLYNLGADGVKGYSQAVNDSGAASRMAATQMDNFSGDLKQLKGSIDVALIQGGSGANVILRDMAQFATKVVNAFASLPKPLQEAAVGFSGGAGTALLLVGGLTSIAGKAASTKKTLSEVSEASTGLKGALASAGSFMAGPWGLAIAGAATVVAVFATRHKDAAVAVNSFTDAIKADGNAIGGTTTQAVAADLASKGLFETYTKLGVSSTTVTNAALGNADALKQVNDATMSAIAGTDGHSAASMKQAVSLGSALQTVKAYSGGIHDQLVAQQQATAATQDSTAATGMSAAAQAKAAQAAKDAAAAQFAQSGAQRAAADAARVDAEASGAGSVATSGHTAAKVSDTAVTNAATAATKANTTASKADTAAQKDQAKASTDQSKADTAATKSSDAAANATKVSADANATAAQKKKANSEATSAATKAANSQTTADNAASHASDAASAASDKHAAANDKSAKASSAAADAASKQAAATSDAAKQAAADAEAARQAAEVHKLGVTWLLAVADAESQASGSADALDSSVTDEVSAMKDAQTTAGTLKDALDALNGVHIAASRAAVDEQQKVADLTKAFSDNGKSLDITTDAGRKNITAIDDLATAANAHAQAVAEESGSISAGNKALDASRAEFDAVLKSAGYSTTQIAQFNKTLLNTPTLATVTLDVKVDTSAAAAALNALASKYAGVIVGGGPGGKRIVSGYATGGLVAGYGTGTSDSNDVAVSNKEYIVNAAAVARPGVLAELNALNFGSGNATVVKPMVSMHSMAAAAGGPGAGGGGTLQVEFAPGGGEGYFLRWLRNTIRVSGGGNVQAFLGTN